MLKALGFAVERTTPTATTWWFGPLGGCLGAFLLWVAGVPVTFSEFITNGIVRSAFEVLVCVLVAYAVLFLACLALAPFHFKLEAQGGIRVYLKKRGVRQMWPQYAMVLGGTIFLVGLVGFLQLNVSPPSVHNAPEKPGIKIGPESNTDPNARGFFAWAFIRLYDTPELRRKYILDFEAPTNARFSFYVSPSDLFVLSATDINKETYSLEVPISSDAIPLNRYIYLYCEVALEERSTRVRILVDGKQVAERILGVRIELGKDYWKWKHITFGADTDGKNNAPFKIAGAAHGHIPLTDAQVFSLNHRFESSLGNSPLQHR